MHCNMMSRENKYQEVRIDAYDYPLPQERIAKYPLAERDQCLLLHDDGAEVSTHIFAELPELLPSDSLLVMNDTKVIRARLEFFRETGARIEIFCLEPSDPPLYETSLATYNSVTWHCLIGNARKWKEAQLTRQLPAGGQLTVERVGEHLVRFSWDIDATFGEILMQAGELPIPPYLQRDTEEGDLWDYQTVYAEHEGSVAAPTAGLHFTPKVFKSLEEKGVRQEKLTLHVGAGTFLPVKSETMAGHTMHKEVISVSLPTLQALLQQHISGQPIVAVGTTTTRTLESLYYMGHQLLAGEEKPFEVPQWLPYTLSPRYTLRESLEALVHYLVSRGEEAVVGRTQLLIQPGFEYRLVDHLITNFHQPKSTLLLLVAAFLGEERWRELYRYALERDFRFLSYGDAMLLSGR